MGERGGSGGSHRSSHYKGTNYSCKYSQSKCQSTVNNKEQHSPWGSCGSGADPGSVCVAMVVVEIGRVKDEDEVEEEEEEEGRRTCSCVFSLITSSYEGGG